MKPYDKILKKEDNIPKKITVTNSFLVGAGGAYGIDCIDENQHKHRFILSYRPLESEGEDGELESGRLFFDNFRIVTRSPAEVEIIELLENAEFVSNKNTGELKNITKSLILAVLNEKRKKKHSKFGNRFMLQNLILFIPGCFIFWKLWTGTNFILYLIFFLLLIATWIIWDRFRLKSFRCPQCNRRVSKPTIEHRKEGDPINYYCSSCDVEWVTGLRVPTGD